jgi:oligopeptide/dipeptide ABC transporter ATP-binding protein
VSNSTGDQAAPVLEFRDYSLGIASPDGPVHNLLDRLSFTVSADSILGVVGESGCGKSLTALSAMRLLPGGMQIQGGDIRFGGQSLLALDARDMQRLRGREIAMIFQEPMSCLNPVHTVGRQIAEVFRIHEPALDEAARRERVLNLLDRVAIANPAQRFGQYPHQLSGGMRQRIMIAMAIALNPRLILADEPTTALDGTIQAQILELIRDLQQLRQGSMLLITHDLGVVGEVCDEVVIMYAGRIVERGTADQIFDEPTHPYTRGLMGSLPAHAVQGQTLQSIPGTVPSVERFASGCRFAPRCSLRSAQCDQQAPHLIERSPGHAVACWAQD